MRSKTERPENSDHAGKTPGQTRPHVADDGRGFSTRRAGKGMGINIMNYRADAVGGNLTVESADGHGTKVTCTLPSG